MANTPTGPWNPDPDTKPGVLGERGTSSFEGTADFAAYDADHPDTGGSKANTGKNAYGDAPTVHSDRSATAFVYRTPKSNQAYEDERATARGA